MGKIDEDDAAAVVSDAGPIIHLDELGCLDLLYDLGPILVPAVVWHEVTRHRPALRAEAIPNLTVVRRTHKLSDRLRSLVETFSLDAGEIAAIALSQEVDARLLLCDDAAARLAAESIGITVRGTIGLIVRAVRQSTRTRDDVLDLLRKLPERSSLYISPKLLDSVIATVEGEAK